MSDRCTESWSSLNGSNFCRSTLFFTFVPIAGEMGSKIGSILSGKDFTVSFLRPMWHV